MKNSTLDRSLRAKRTDGVTRNGRTAWQVDAGGELVRDLDDETPNFLFDSSLLIGDDCR